MDNMITTAQAAKILGIAPPTVTWRVRNGHLNAAYQAPGRGIYLFDADYIASVAGKTKAAAK